MPQEKSSIASASAARAGDSLEELYGWGLGRPRAALVQIVEGRSGCTQLFRLLRRSRGLRLRVRAVELLPRARPPELPQLGVLLEREAGDLPQRPVGVRGDAGDLFAQESDEVAHGGLVFHPSEAQSRLRSHRARRRRA